MSKIISIGTAVPKYATSQSSILSFMLAAYHDETASRLLKVLFKQSGINTRYSAVPDFDNSLSDHVLFNGDEHIPSVADRSGVFRKQANLLALEAIRKAFANKRIDIPAFGITHLIAVTCTGIYSPGLDTELMEQLNLPNDIFHTSMNFLGCNAAFPALKLADMIAKTEENARVLIVCVELCTLHFQPKNNHDNLLSNTLFGDGAAAVILTADNETNGGRDDLLIEGFYSLLLNKGKDLMGWNITPVNFEMILNAKVPEFIGSEVDNILMKAGNKFNIDRSGIEKWAIHPGGKKILDVLKKQLKLNDTDLKYSYKVLEEFGNMSSPTILFVLKEIMDAPHRQNEKIFSIGFGPGLSIETALFTHAG